MEILPSLFNSDILNLQSELAFMESQGIKTIHIDMMDGNFVPNISFGPDQLREIKKNTAMKIDVHMMVQHPEKLIDLLADAGVDMISFHYEATPHPHEIIRLIKAKNIKVGVALSPATLPEVLTYLLDDLDFILLMSINPGFWHQDFIPTIYQKIEQTKALIGERNILIEIDGRMNVERIQKAAEKGADLFVVGSNLFSGDKEKNINALQSLAGGK
ncbi:ribulose-phosphate 3-epimerase [Enterococcus pallens]|uniref:Ribulose-phosphate 3-epimerase n=1 Tax=Enterococcus pallens ATCC BAA-351 TaxID=1158607 RepID=R2SRY7_9ENTE|nr:ribulose-phosphate 3-epimerase [Enterococcus pallens]EOH95576.1 ribulose-phosphate 3-epimerase [Enterococcus pallens ATCC BAA-351]EOU21287.1 ribulose-phosphate 3-epimerase [Enterococcus pallens ATCC BAA-351]